jgi:hypothetical protein
MNENSLNQKYNGNKYSFMDASPSGTNRSRLGNLVNIKNVRPRGSESNLL